MNGAPVKSYDAGRLLFIGEGPAHQEKARLDFEGRNACLYFRP